MARTSLGHPEDHCFADLRFDFACGPPDCRHRRGHDRLEKARVRLLANPIPAAFPKLSQLQITFIVQLDATKESRIRLISAPSGLSHFMTITIASYLVRAERKETSPFIQPHITFFAVRLYYSERFVFFWTCF